MPPPPPPPPPGPGPPPPPPASGGGSKGGGAPPRSALLDQIHQGARLKKALTNDRSAPQIVVKNSGGGHESRGGGGGGHESRGGGGGGHESRGGGGGNTSSGGPAALGGLFAGGMPKLKSAGQTRVPGGAGGPALKPPSSTSNGPVNVPQSGDKGRLINGGPPPPPPSSSNKPTANKVLAPAGPPGLGRPVNTAGPLPPSNGGTPGRLNSNITNRFNSSSAAEDKGVSGASQPNVSLIAAGLASRNTPSHSPVPKPSVSIGGHQTAAATPPPPPSRPPPSNSTRPNSMVGRPLPLPPGDSGSNAVGPARPPPPPPSRSAAPTPPNRSGAPPPPPPQRTTSNVNVVGGTIGRSGPPSRPPSRRASTGGGLPAPPQIQPPTGPRKSGSQSSNEDDFETRFRFHQPNEFTPPEPFSNMNKTYPSKNPRNSNRQRPPPPMPPR